MANMRLIDANALSRDAFHIKQWGKGIRCVVDWDDIEAALTVDAVPVADIEAWLYQIAMNNTGNPLSAACVEIINRLEGLRQFSRERDADNG